MRVRCPHCGKSASVPDTDAGLLGVCAACGTSYRAPEAAAAPSVGAMADERAVPADGPQLRSWWLRPAGLWTAAALVAVLTTIVVVLVASNWRGGNKAVAVDNSKMSTAIITDRKSMTGPTQPPHARTAHPDTAEAPGQQLSPSRPAEVQESSPPPAPPEGGSAGFATAEPAPPETLPADPAPAQRAPPRPAPPQTRPGQLALQADPEPALKVQTTQPTVPPVASRAPVRPPVQRISVESDDLDSKIGQSITHGIDYVLAQFDPRTHLLRGLTPATANGALRGEDILCVYALMQCQEATGDRRINPHDPLMKGMIDAMKSLNLTRYPFETYSRGLRATALALYNRPEDRGILGMDALALLKGNRLGGYTYMLSQGGSVNSWDNSNSQYGLLGVWSAAEVGFEVPTAYWALVQRHWIQSQCRSGQWAYTGNREDGTHSMTCAGLASSFVTHDYLDIPQYGADVGRDPFTPQIVRGLGWLEQGVNAVTLDHGPYDLYGLERVGLASGFKYFGRNDWYRILAGRTVAAQKADGGWGGNVDTAYSLLFLSRGRHPILMNKLRFTGYWANRPRDVANLARFAGYQLERPLNWQVVPITRDWTDWMDSPILYLASHKAPKLSEDEYRKIRTFCENGGLLFMQADGNAREFERFAHETAHKLFGNYEMTDLPPSHPLCSVMFKVKPGSTLKMVSNGSRILMLFSNIDISKYWQLRDDKHKTSPFELGTDIFLYAAGRRDLRNRLVSTYIPPVTAAPRATFGLARLSYSGNWNPEPAAWERFGRWFQIQTGYQLKVVQVPIAQLKPETAPIAELTGTARYELTAPEVAALKNYVEAGGVLLVDLCGGTGGFDKSLQSLYFNAFAGSPPKVMPSGHPMLNASANGMEDLSSPRLRQFAADVVGSHSGLPEEIAAGKGHVIFTSLDITTALLGTDTWGIVGYEPRYAQALVKNAILWTVDGQHEGGAVAKR